MAVLRIEIVEVHKNQPMVEPVRDLQSLLDALGVVGDPDRVDDPVPAVDIANLPDRVNGNAVRSNAVEDRRRR